jgi:hypothetical protein
MKKTILAVAVAAVALAGCEVLEKADRITEAAVTRVCGQPEAARKVEREKLADWGLWAKCVGPGAVYDGYELVSTAGTVR